VEDGSVEGMMLSLGPKLGAWLFESVGVGTRVPRGELGGRVPKVGPPIVGSFRSCSPLGTELGWDVGSRLGMSDDSLLGCADGPRLGLAEGSPLG
jgi:hypothetical protein